MNVQSAAVFKEKFEKSLYDLPRAENSFAIISEEHYSELLREVMHAKSTSKKTAKDYRRLKKYDIMVTGPSSTKLIRPVKSNENSELSSIKSFVHYGEVFDILHSIHIQTGHGGIHKMEHAVHDRYANIGRPIIHLFLRHCEICVTKRTHPKKGVVVKPMVFKNVNARAQIDLIDMQSCRDREFKFILNYQEHLSKYLCLRALKTKTAAEVAYNVIDLFCLFGAPSVLQSDNGREFVNSIIDELKVMWPQLSIVHGKPRHSQSQGSVERANQDVEGMIQAWMADNESNQWGEGLRFVQMQKNNSYHQGIKQSPFEAMFGRKMLLGINVSVLPTSVTAALSTEEELAETVAEAHINDEDDDGTKSRNQLSRAIKRNQSRAFAGLESQAKRMKVASDAKFGKLEVGSCVTVPVPGVDRSKGDLRNIIGKCVLHVLSVQTSVKYVTHFFFILYILQA